MEQATKGRKTGPRLLRWWMILVCLLASWLCWWSVNKWLEPRPLWSRTLPERRLYSPLCEDADGEKLLVAEMQYDQVRKYRKTKALVILDKNNGKQLHRLEVKEPDLLSDGEMIHVPRILNNAVWRVSTIFKNNVTIHRLHSWKFKEEQIEKIVHTWTGLLPSNYLRLYWPEKSRVIVLNYAWPLSHFYATPQTHLLVAVTVKLLHNQFLFPIPSWNESWQLPEEAGQSPQRLARWNTPSGYWQSSPNISDNGRWALFTEPWGDARLAAQRGRATGRSNFQGEELFNLFRSESKAILAYETATGKLRNRYQDEKAHQSIGGWQDNCFVTMSFQASPDKVLTLQEINTGAANTNLNLFSHSFIYGYHVFRIDADGPHELRWPTGFPPAGVPWSLSHQKLLTSYPLLRGYTLRDRLHYALKIEGDQITILRSAKVSENAINGWNSWLGKAAQYSLWRSSLWARIQLRWQNQWPWLDYLLNKVSPYLKMSMDFVVVDDDSGTVREHSFQQTVCVGSYFEFSHLFLYENEEAEKEGGSVTLNCYQLPMRLSSPWWGRGAACVPMVLLLMYLMSRQRMIIQNPSLARRAGIPSGS